MKIIYNVFLIPSVFSICFLPHRTCSFLFPLSLLIPFILIYIPRKGLLRSKIRSHSRDLVKAMHRLREERKHLVFCA